MSNRHEWKVQYTGAKLASAAAEKKAFHEGRHTWWVEKRQETISKIRSEGINITDSIVDELGKSYSSNVSHAKPTIQIDAALQAHLMESHGKMKSHESLIKDYDSWAQMMGAHPDAVFELHQEDWVYFFGK